MTKIETLNVIIQSMCGRSDSVAIENICNAVSESYASCAEIDCNDCPFYSSGNFDKLSIELDEEKK